MTNMEINNPFELDNEATRYNKYRPKYHHLPFQKIVKTTGHNFQDALDVACGTGHSTIALSEIANKVTGCDLSEPMLKEARRNSNHLFIKANAKDLPFEDSCFDFINISMAFHWLDQIKFLKEARRVLKSSGYLAIDSYGFLRDISENDYEKKLHDDIFKKYLKSASRNPSYPTNKMISQSKFQVVKDFKYKHTVSLSAHEFSNLLMTWSNYQILNNQEKAIAEKKIYETYNIIFKNKKLDLNFGGRTILLQNIND